jgi:hypothetical protein
VSERRQGGAGAKSPFLALSPDERHAIERKLGVSYAPEHAGELDRAAVRYVEQGHAFERIAEIEGFAHETLLAIDEPRAALVLTITGSLVLIGAPEPPKGRRRFVYQSIRSEGPPREGSLRLVDPIRQGQPIVGSRLKSSPVRALGAAARTAGWEDCRGTLSTLTATLGKLDVGPPVDIAIGGVRSVFVQDERTRRKNAELEQTILRAEAELSALLARLVGENVHDDALEAEVVGTALYLGRLGIERGRESVDETKVSRFDTATGEACIRSRDAIELYRPGMRALRIEGGSVAGSEVVVGAPVAVLDRAGALVAVLGRVRRVERK